MFLDEQKVGVAETIVELYESYMASSTDQLRDPSLRGFMKWLRAELELAGHANVILGEDKPNGA